MREGEIVLKRSICHGRVGICCGPGNQGKAMRRGPLGLPRDRHVV